MTVVIPAYNAAAFIRATLDSVLKQTVPPEELIVIDDASKDGTVQVVEEQLRNAPFPWRVIRLEKNCGGPGAPMNAGIKAAREGWIVPLDHDDELMPDRVERLRGLPPGLTIGRLRVREASRDRGHLLDAAWSRVQDMKLGDRVLRDAAYEGLAKHGCYAMSCSAMAFPKSLWQRHRFDETLVTCIDFAFLESALRDGDLQVIDAPVAYWTWRAENLSHDAPRRVFEVSTVMQRIHEHRPDLDLRAAMLRRCYYLSVRGRHGEAKALLRQQRWGWDKVKTVAKCQLRRLV